MSQVRAPTKANRALSVGSLEDLPSSVRAIAGGDEAALSDLYYEFAGLTFSIAKRIVGSKESAQEVVCDVFMYVWQHAQAFNAERGTVAAWLSVITRRRAIDRWRRNRKFVHADDDDLLSARSFGPSHPERILSAFQQDSAVYSALGALSPLRRHLIGLAFFKDLTHEEIATATNLPVGTVKSHVRRALRSMRATFEMQLGEKNL